jgi:hypothetical protein
MYHNHHYSNKNIKKSNYRNDSSEMFPKPHYFFFVEKSFTPELHSTAIEDVKDDDKVRLKK